MKKLKTILQSNKVFWILFVIIVIYVLIFTKLIKYHSKLDIDDTSFIGNINSYKIDGDKLTLELNGIEKIIVYYYFDTEEEKNAFANKFGTSDQIKVVGELNELSNNTIPNTFNYKKYLYNKHIYYTFNASNIFLVNDNKCLKDIFINKLNNYKNKEYMYTFILGDKSYLDITTYQNNGVSHLLAISGMHVSFLISFLEDKFKIKNKIILNILLFLYSYLVSFAVGVLRVLIFRILKSFNLEISNIKTLFLTFFILLLYNPFYIYDYGFIYSFLISGAIMICNIKGNYLVKLLKISFISFLVAIPVNVSMNYKINLMTIFNNLINVPYVTFVVFPMSLISFFIPKVELIFNYLIKLLEFINNNSYSLNVVIPKLNIIFISLYYLIFYCFIKINNKKILILIIILIIIHKYKYLIDNNFYIYYLDVSQGDSILLVSPRHSAVILIDTGGKVNYTTEEWRKKLKDYYVSDNVMTFLNSISISGIDYLIITHGDNDHMGDAKHIVSNFNVSKVIFNCGDYNDLESELIDGLDGDYHECINKLNIGNYELEFLNTGIYDNENDNSSVIYLNYNNYKFLFMGDASVEREENILEKYNLDKIDFLKVGHHGSDTSSSEEFINTVLPRYSIISVGKNNRYGHPKDSVLDILEGNGSKIYRTDIDGSIKIKIKSDGYTIKTCDP